MLMVSTTDMCTCFCNKAVEASCISGNSLTSCPRVNSTLLAVSRTEGLLYDAHEILACSVSILRGCNMRTCFCSSAAKASCISGNSLASCARVKSTLLAVSRSASPLKDFSARDSAVALMPAACRCAARNHSSFAVLLLACSSQAARSPCTCPQHRQILHI